MKKILYIIFSMLLISCGSRKSEVNKTHEERKIYFAENKKEHYQETKEASTLTETNEDEFIITPIDTARPIEITAPDGKKTSVKNGKIEKRKKSVTKEKNETVNKSYNSDTDTKLKAKENKVTKAKTTDREALFSWWWLLFIIPIIYIVYRIKKWA